MQLPILTIPSVYHVGDLRLEFQKNRSLEGQCLSVSLCPNAWAQIARLGDDMFCLSRHDAAPGIFLDAIAFSKSPKNRKLLKTFAITNGYTTVEDRWRVTYYDDEADENRFFECASLTKARDESDEYDAATIRKIKKLVRTEKLSARADRHHQADDPCDESLLIAFLLDHAFQVDGRPIDGLWWRERYDPYNYSAPRAGILPDHISNWRPGPALTVDDVDDEALLDDMPQYKIQNAKK